MKRKIALMLVLALLAFSLGAAAQGGGMPLAKSRVKFRLAIEVKGKIKPLSSYSMETGTEVDLYVNITAPADYAPEIDSVFTDDWEIADVVLADATEVAARSQGANRYLGKLKAFSAGKTDISVADYDNDVYGNIIGDLKLTVKPATITGIEVREASYEIGVGGVFDLSTELMLQPSAATTDSVTFKSSNKKVASVDKTGHVVAKAAGQATITVKSKGKNAPSATCQVNVHGAVTPDPNEVTYRFFGIGQNTYRNANPLPACIGDVNLMSSAYRHASWNGRKMALENVHVFYNQKGSQIKNILKSMADCGADDNDVTVFFYSGHGDGDEEEPGWAYNGALCGVDVSPYSNKGVVTVNEVVEALDKVPGHVVVILDSCFSGQYIERKGLSAFRTAAKIYSRRWINAFARSSVRAKYDGNVALPDSTQAPKYQVITACESMQLSSTDGPDFSLFTEYVAEGLGQNKYLTAGPCALLADKDGDKAVTLAELYKYVDDQVKAREREYYEEDPYEDDDEEGEEDPYEDDDEWQVTMVWPVNSPFEVIERS